MKKRLSAALLAAAVMMFAGCSEVGYEDYVISDAEIISPSAAEDFLYDTDEEFAIVMSYEKENEKVGIPAEIEGKKVTTIGEDSFSCRTFLKAVTLPESAIIIEKGAFGYCSELSSVYLPASLEEIGDEAFLCCTALEGIKLPEALRVIGDDAFEGCEELKAVELPKSIDYLGDYAFNGCKKLQKVTLPDEIKYLGDEPFYGCERISVSYRGKTYSFKQLSELYSDIEANIPESGEESSSKSAAE